jgi:hypothetical protein
MATVDVEYVLKIQNRQINAATTEQKQHGNKMMK